MRQLSRIWDRIERGGDSAYTYYVATWSQSTNAAATCQGTHMTTRRHLAERIREEREIRQFIHPRTFRSKRQTLTSLLRQPSRRVVVRTQLTLLMLRERQARAAKIAEISYPQGHRGRDR